MAQSKLIYINDKCLITENLKREVGPNFSYPELESFLRQEQDDEHEDKLYGEGQVAFDDYEMHQSETFMANVKINSRNS